MRSRCAAKNRAARLCASRPRPHPRRGNRISVGFHFDLANLREGETIVDLGSGSGMDSFIAALKVGPGGRVIGVDMTDEQRGEGGAAARWRRLPRGRLRQGLT
jgi:cyclopropane fatty-acyl-phospholipid synthase-like methyltransferase